MLRCSEVTRLHASGEIQGASWRRRIAVRLHLLMCRGCRRYIKELAAIGAAARHLAKMRPEDEGRTEAILRRVLPDEHRSDH